MAQQEQSQIDVEPLSAVMAAAVPGLDLRQAPDEGTVTALRAALIEHLVLVIPGQRLEPASLVAFAGRLGELEIHVLDQYRLAGYPEIYHLSNIAADGGIVDEHPDKGTLIWHSDLSFKARPASFTVLYGREVPRSGADTLYVNLYAAYDSLPDTMKQRIAGMRAVHDLDFSRRRSAGYAMSEAQRREAPPVSHPLVRRHPESGRDLLYVGSHCSHIEGLPAQEGEALLQALIAHATEERFLYRHRWFPGDVVIWDNRCTLHKATPYDTAHERRDLYRCVVGGEAVVAPPDVAAA